MSSVFLRAAVATNQDSGAPAAKATKRWAALAGVAKLLGLAATPAPASRAARAARPVVRAGWQHHRQAMLAACEGMLRRAEAAKQPMSIAVFDLSDLPELENLFGPDVAKQVIAKVTNKLQSIATSRGLAVRTGSRVFTVLMPGYCRDKAHLAIQKFMGRPCRIELDLDDDEIVLIPGFKVHTLRAGSDSLPQVYEDLCRDIADARQAEQRRRDYLQRERESHTRPMELQADSAPRPAKRRRARPGAQITIPMPLRP
jgi:GGDEF domain-containing protein